MRYFPCTVRSVDSPARQHFSKFWSRYSGTPRSRRAYGAYGDPRTPACSSGEVGCLPFSSGLGPGRGKGSLQVHAILGLFGLTEGRRTDDPLCLHSRPPLRCSGAGTHTTVPTPALPLSAGKPRWCQRGRRLRHSWRRYCGEASSLAREDIRNAGGHREAVKAWRAAPKYPPCLKD